MRRRAGSDRAGGGASTRTSPPSTGAPGLHALARVWGCARRHTLDHPVAQWPIDLFRVLVGCISFGYSLRVWQQASTFTHPDGLIDHVLVNMIYDGWNLQPLFRASMGAAWVDGVLGAAALLSICVALGVGTRVSAFSLYLIFVSLYRCECLFRPLPCLPDASCLRREPDHCLDRRLHRAPAALLGSDDARGPDSILAGALSDLARGQGPGQLRCATRDVECGFALVRRRCYEMVECDVAGGESAACRAAAANILAARHLGCGRAAALAQSSNMGVSLTSHRVRIERFLSHA